MIFPNRAMARYVKLQTRYLHVLRDGTNDITASLTVFLAEHELDKHERAGALKSSLYVRPASGALSVEGLEGSGEVNVRKRIIWLKRKRPVCICMP